jgi:hypothetical protein
MSPVPQPDSMVEVTLATFPHLSTATKWVVFLPSSSSVSGGVILTGGAGTSSSNSLGSPASMPVSRAPTSISSARVAT